MPGGEAPRYRRVSCAIHNDPWFRGLDSDGRLLMLTLLTHPDLRSGVVRTHPAMLAVEQGWSQPRLDKALSSLEAAVLVEPLELAVGMPKWIKHNQPENPSVAVSTGRQLREAPAGRVREAVVAWSYGWLLAEKGPAYATGYLTGVGTPVPAPVGTGVVAGGGDKEQEQEQEQEQETPTPLKSPPPRSDGSAGALVRQSPSRARGRTRVQGTLLGEDGEERTTETVAQTELGWRISRVWEAHLAQRRGFFVDEVGVAPQDPALTADIRGDIRAALLTHDRDRLEAADRERWTAESPVLGAGVGLFLDPWCSGTSPQNDARNGGKRYLDAWRPWRQQKGKPDPVPRFAELYFVAKGVARAAGGGR